MDAKTKDSLTNENIRDLLNNSANKTNNNLIFFFSFGLYVFISVINTSDIALLLPRHSFKMPFIDFELGLLHFYVLAPLLLLLLHFNLLFNHYKNLEKLDKYKNKVNLTTINPSLYGFAFVKGGKIEGFFINLVLYLLLYILPLIVFMTMYIRFADYHHSGITPLHLIIIMFDLLFIALSILYCSKYSFSSPSKFHSLKHGLIYILLLLSFITLASMSLAYYYQIYKPIVREEYSSSFKNIIKKTMVCKIILYFTPGKYDVCFPRLVVAEEEMARISKDALYIPRHLTMENTNTDDIEHDLIINHGTRIDLSDRNLRYAILKGNILTRADFTKSQLQATNLTGAHMQATILSQVDLRDAIMINVKLESAYLDGTDLQGATLVNADMQEIQANSYSVEENKKRSNFSNVQMQQANLTNASFTGANLSNVDLRKADLTKTNFTGATLIGSSFSKAIISESQFIGANLTGSDFSEVKVEPKKCKQLKGMPDNNTSNDNNNSLKCGYPNFKNSIMSGANLWASKLEQYFELAKLTSTQLYETIDANTSDYRLYETRKVQYLDKGIDKIKMNSRISDDNKTKIIYRMSNLIREECNNITKELKSKNVLPKKSITEFEKVDDNICKKRYLYCDIINKTK